jgi:hypothetical protein
MDKAPLVGGRIEDGQKLIEQLVRDGFDVTLAFWVRFKDEADGPWFYVISKTVDHEGVQAAYRAVHAAIHRVSGPFGPWLFDSEVSDLKLVGMSDSIANEVLAIRNRFPGRIRFRGTIASGPSYFEELYIYPPPSEVGDERWRGIMIPIWPEPEPENAYYVEFWPKEMAAMVDQGGLPKRVPRPAGVRVQGGHVTEYRPPEKPLAHLGREDYERKALEAVDQVAAKSN